MGINYVRILQLHVTVFNRNVFYLSIKKKTPNIGDASINSSRIKCTSRITKRSNNLAKILQESLNSARMQFLNNNKVPNHVERIASETVVGRMSSFCASTMYIQPRSDPYWTCIRKYLRRQFLLAGSCRIYIG